MRWTFLIAFLFCGVLAEGQQLPHYSQFDQNRFLIDPAVAGSKPYFRTRLHARAQWVGFQGAPRTGILSIEGPLKRENMGIGGYFFKDEAGPAERNGGQLAYSYHFRVDEVNKLSLGLGLGVLQYRINRDELVLYDQGDEVFMGGDNGMSAIEPDASFGAFFYGRRYGVGISGFQLLHNRVNWEGSNSRLDGHYFLHAYYETPLSEELTLRPTFMTKYVPNTDPQFEFGGRLIYRDMLWGGLNYRTQDAVSAMLGYRLKDKWSIGYSYDMTLTELRNYNTGSHELMLGYRFHPKVGGKDDEEEDL